MLSVLSLSMLAWVTCRADHRQCVPHAFAFSAAVRHSLASSGVLAPGDRCPTSGKEWHQKLRHLDGKVVALAFIKASRGIAAV